MNLLYSLLSASLVVAVALGSTTEDPSGTVPTDNGDTDSPGGPDPTTPGIETEICWDDGNCYSLTDTASTWAAARVACSEDLAVLDTTAEITWVHGNLNRLFDDATKTVWIGAERTDNVTTWITDSTDELDEVDDLDDGCVVAVYSGTDVDWEVVGCDTPPQIGLCEQPKAAGGDGGLSDGEIAAIAVSSSLVVGGAAAGGGYYAYSKSKGAVAPAAGSQGSMGENKDEEEEKEEEEAEQGAEEV